MEQNGASGVGQAVNIPERDETAEPAEELGILAGSPAGMALLALIALNLLDFVDRSLLSGAQPVIQRQLHATDARLGGVTSGFFIAYMVAAPLVGWLGDRLPRRILVPLSVIWWSCALGAATLGTNFRWFPLGYIMVGIAQASFGVYSVAMVSDYYPRANRTRALSLFLLAMNGGRALGIPLGGSLAESFGWQTPFRLMAAVGLILGLWAMKFFYEPGQPVAPRSDSLASGGSRPSAFSAILSKGYLGAALGLAMVNFVLGGLSVWLPTYLCRFAGYSVSRAGATVGAITLVCGIGGTWFGGVLGEKLYRGDQRGLYWMSAGCLLLAVPFAFTILSYSQGPILFGIIGTQLFVFLTIGPLNAALLNSVPSWMRSTAVAIEIFLIHALGDGLSPRLIGVISDARGLRLGLATTAVALTIGGLLVFAGTEKTPVFEGDPAQR